MLILSAKRPNRLYSADGVLAFQEKAVDETFWRASIHVDDPRGDLTRQRLQDMYTTKIWPENADHSLRHGAKGGVVWLGKNAFFENWTWESLRNKNKIGIDWQFTTADARIKLRKLYPTI